MFIFDLKNTLFISELRVDEQSGDTPVFKGIPDGDRK
jgi:hypothetical protein